MKNFILTLEGKEIKGRRIEINTLWGLVPNYELIYVDEKDGKLKTVELTKAQLLDIEVIDDNECVPPATG